ncbi:MAG: hypothetical protein J5563_00805 [Clostridia bacterium]|nr:hypothetical protein [Clostridia bacterium]
MLYEERLTEQTVKRKFEGKLKKKAVLAALLFIGIPLVITLAVFFAKRSFSSLLFYGLPLFALSGFVALLSCRFFFRIEYDYSLLGYTFSVCVVRNSRLRSEKYEADLRSASVFPVNDIPSERYREIYRFLPSDRCDGMYGIETHEEKDAEIKDLCLIQPDKRMLKAMSDINRSMRIRK